MLDLIIKQKAEGQGTLPPPPKAGERTRKSGMERLKGKSVEVSWDHVEGALEGPDYVWSYRVLKKTVREEERR